MVFIMQDMPEQPHKIPDVVLSISTSREYERGIARGVFRYARLQGPWNFHRQIPSVSGGKDIGLEELQELAPDGLVWREKHGMHGKPTFDLPTVVAPFSEPFDDCINIMTNDLAIGKLAAEHLLDRGFVNFAYYSLGDGYYWARARQESFTKRIADAGLRVQPFADPHPDAAMAQITDWILSLPKPVGLMACTDDCAQACLGACKRAKLSIPEDVALIGVGNDEMVCELSSPQLTSIELHTEKAGYDAARLLANWMAGEPQPERTVIVDPGNVVTRVSTDTFAAEDRHIAKALRFIRENVMRKVQVDDVVRAVHLSRRNLYARFQKALGRSVYEEILRARMDQVARMLIHTDLSIDEIARDLAYPDAKNLARTFRKERGLTPREFRRRYKVPTYAGGNQPLT